MRVLIMHTDHPKVQASAVALQQGLEKQGLNVGLVSPSTVSSAPVSTAPYHLVCVISEFKGWWKPQIPTEVDNLLKRATRLAGKRGGAFVIPGLGSGKALRALMAHMERQGVMVEDFGTLSGGEQQALATAERLGGRLVLGG